MTPPADDSGPAGDGPGSGCSESTSPALSGTVQGGQCSREMQKLVVLSRLATSLAHELSNPIQAILNYVELIQQTDDAGQAGDFAGEIATEAERVSKTMRELLELAMPDSRPPRAEAVSDLVEAVRSLMNSALMRDQIRLSVELSPRVTAVKCCGQQIRQLLLNLICNSRESLNAVLPTDGAEKRIEIRAATFFADADEWLRLEVRDFGVGATSETLERAFEPYFTDKKGIAHQGLGLSVSRAIATEHGGRLTLSAAAPGLVATLELPVAGNA